MRKPLCIALIFSLFLFVAWSAQAKPLTWTLQDVRFDDGGAASGFFVFDPETIEFDQQNQEWIATPPTIFDIVTTGLVVGGEFHYQPPQQAFICEPIHCSNFGIYFGSFLILVFEFDAPLPVAGGTVPLGGVEMLFEEVGFVREITAGSLTTIPEVSTIPEPAGYALLGVGLSLLALVRRGAARRVRRRGEDQRTSIWQGFMNGAVTPNSQTAQASELPVSRLGIGNRELTAVRRSYGFTLT